MGNELYIVIMSGNVRIKKRLQGIYVICQCSYNGSVMTGGVWHDTVKATTSKASLIAEKLWANYGMDVGVTK